MTACDRLAASPEDAARVAPGVADTDMDVAGAVTACRDAVASSPNSPRLRFQYGRALQLAESYEKAGVALLLAANDGHIRAMLHLASMHIYGELGKPESDFAVYWLMRAAEKGSADALWLLGWIYETGYGLPQDYARAAGWYRRAAVRGHHMGRNSLGWLYAKGRGVPRDQALAAQWYDGAWSVDDLTNNEVARNFEIVSFALDEEAFPRFEAIHKWRAPVRIVATSLLDGHDEPEARARFSRYLRMANKVVDGLSRQTGIDIKLYAPNEIPRDDVNAVLFFVENINERLNGKPIPRLVTDEIRRRSGGDPAAVPVFTPRNLCSLYYAYADGVIHGANIFITAGMHDDAVYACLVEELTQMLGLAGDSVDVMPSIFNDASPFRERTDHDDLLLRILYDKRITPGMPRAEAVAMARKILEEERPGQ